MKPAVIFLSFFLFCLSACSEKEKNKIEETPSNPIVFAKGADVSWLPQMEATGYVFKDRNGAI